MLKAFLLSVKSIFKRDRAARSSYWNHGAPYSYSDAARKSTLYTLNRARSLVLKL